MCMGKHVCCKMPVKASTKLKFLGRLHAIEFHTRLFVHLAFRAQGASVTELWCLHMAHLMRSDSGQMAVQSTNEKGG